MRESISVPDFYFSLHVDGTSEQQSPRTRPIIYTHITSVTFMLLRRFFVQSDSQLGDNTKASAQYWGREESDNC